MELSGKLSQKCLIKFINRFSCSFLFWYLFGIEKAKAAPEVNLALPDPMEFVRGVEEQAFQHLGQIMGILVTLIGLKWMLQAIKNGGS